MKNVKNKKLALGVVALILAALTAVSMTYAWIDDVKLVEFDNDSLSDNRAPLKTGVDINSTVNITKDDNTINLGNLLENSDLTVSTGEGQRTEVKHDLTNTEKANINKKKGYFYESGGMHLSPCYSDGETFYFERQSNQQSNQISYREGNKDDENVNYISYTVKVTSPDANVDFWFKSIPSIAVANSENLISNARIAITTDGNSHVYSSTGLANTISNSAMVPVSGVRRFSSYTYNDESNKTVARGENSNTLFSVKKGSTVILNIKIWLESGFDTSIEASDIDLQLVSSWAYTRKITILDRTTSNTGSSWIRNGTATLFLTCPAVLEENAKKIYNNPGVDNWKQIPGTTGYEKAPFYQLALDSGTTDTYSVNVPLVYCNEEMILYRCSAQGWNSNANDAAQRSDYNVYCWNWWKSSLPNTFKDETYTLYGSSQDNVAKQEFNDVTENYKGYGTWGPVEEISVYSHYGNTDYASHNTEGAGSRLFVRDHSDEDTSGEIYTFVMHRENNNSDTPWKAYIPATSSKIQFYYHLGNATGTWGYKSWNEENPQRRPLKSTGLYASNSTVYHFAQNYGTDQGWGYWEGADTVYLIKSSFLSQDSTVAHAYMFNSTTDKKEAYPGETLTRLKDTSNNDVSYTWDGGTKTTGVWYTGSPRVYKKIVFNNGYGGDIGVDKTGDLNLFPGCFYQVDGSKWYGSLDDVGRAASATETGGDSGGGSGGGTDIGGGSMDGFTEPTKFVFKINGKEYDVKTDGTTYKVRLSLTAGDNWTTVLKKEGNYPTYGNGQSGQYYETKSNMDLYLTTANSSDFSIRTASSGNFIAAFQCDNGNQNTIKITSILKED